jgi:dihydrofolate reductase
MRNLYVFNMVSLDGFFEGPNQDIGWHQVDEEFNAFAEQQLAETDLILFGRVTYLGMASFWPTPLALETDPVIAGMMNRISKVVISRTLDKAEWNNTRLINGHVPEEVTKLKQQPGKEIAVFGSANLAASLMSMGLIDEFRIIINPVVLGKGTPLFQNVAAPGRLTLLRTRTFGNGNVLLCYRPAQ